MVRMSWSPDLAASILSKDVLINMIKMVVKLLRRFLKDLCHIFYPVVLLTNSVENRSELSISKFSDKNFI